MIGGSLRGRRLSVPRGDAVRPTSERVREALFDILGPSAAGSRFLDLFAGSGATGIEALSRGAVSVVLVESGAEALRALQANVESLGIAGGVRIVREPWPRALGAAVVAGGGFTIVFADPPYRGADPPSRGADPPRRGADPSHREDDPSPRVAKPPRRRTDRGADPVRGDLFSSTGRAPYVEILESLSAPGILDPDAVVVLEHETRGGAPARGGRLALRRVAPYGRAALAFYQLDSAVLASPGAGV